MTPLIKETTDLFHSCFKDSETTFKAYCVMYKHYLHYYLNYHIDVEDFDMLKYNQFVGVLNDRYPDCLARTVKYPQKYQTIEVLLNLNPTYVPMILAINKLLDEYGDKHGIYFELMYDTMCENFISYTANMDLPDDFYTHIRKLLPSELKIAELKNAILFKLRKGESFYGTN